MRLLRPETKPKRALRFSLAMLTVTALVIGVAPSFIAPQQTFAATLSGGIRDKSGAVEKDAQQASDLPAGSCAVNSNTTSGSQAGFTWQTLEPSATSPDKTLWGLSFSFDNSKDRTFADWSFSGSSDLRV